MNREFPREVKIDINLFMDICRYMKCDDEMTSEEKKELEKRICEQLDFKMDKLIMHALFTRYRQGVTEDERKQALKEFLSHRQTPA